MKKLIFPKNSHNQQNIKKSRKNLPLIFFILSLAFFLFSLYKGLFLPFALSTPPPSTEQQPLQPFEQVVKDAQKFEGLFTLYRNPATNKVYLEIKPQQLDKKFLCFVTLASGLGEGGILSGLPIGDFLFQLRRVQNNVQFVIPNTNFRTRPGDPQAGSVARAFSESILYSLPLKSLHPQRQTLLIDLGDLLMSEKRDLPGVKAILPAILGAAYSIDEEKSYFKDVKAFPLNVEIASIYGFSSDNDSAVNYLPSIPDSRAFNLRIHYSFSEVPLNNGYRPRLADERVGYFLTAYKDFSDKSSRQPFVRYINRWHLQKQIPTAPMSPPVQPIVFWIENNVPLEYRNAIREGILEWNKAFEKAGFTEAIQVKQMPDNAKWDPADVRYNTIRWSSSFESDFAGLGPSRTNPLTGEILDADILLDANIVRLIKQGYRSLVEQNRSLARSFQGRNGSNTNPCQFGMYSRYLPMLENGDLGKNSGENSQGGIADDLPTLVERYREQKRDPLSRLISSSDMCFGLESSRQFAIGAMSMDLSDNAAPSSRAIENYVNDYIRNLTAHEVGHTLGLRHNFHGSTMLKSEDLNNTEVTRAQGMVASVMDYVPINLAPPGTVQGDYYPTIVGPYDDWAIEYGYKVLGGANPNSDLPALQQIASRAGEPQLAYAPDEDAVDNLDPAANTFDLSNNMLRYSQWQLDNAKAMWKRLEKRIPVGEDGYNELRVMFDSVFGYYFQQVMNATLYVGGQSFSRIRPGDINAKLPFVPIALAQQREALATLDKYVFATDAFSFAPDLLNKLAPARWEHWGSPALVFPLDYPIGDRITFMQRFVLRVLLSPVRLTRLRDAELKSASESALKLPELFDTLQKDIWKEVLQPEKKMQISTFRRSLQREHLAILIRMVLRKTSVPEDARTLAWYELRQLREDLSKSIRNLDKNADAYTQSHLEETRDRISKVLNAQIQSN
ncbi:MAG: zinc-dependent metalloprotease [Microcoleus sp. PH2017_22_RUC_O_B]|uniref:zinc-dependent metalloprotease n=1 Tax=unclassified Microcoleus TaxID=2642155 RepID=UPI001D48067A|nr:MULTISPECIES: zinc-dependent metalloprotease [unclassified Microcoleus]MCC3531420.1 zinc-dependent metalloprotease [Microcoleus sp. PH2017_21_RUC_O_A]MCC3543741.1 zinc-dependent metalloprotease [Microcoleus sp. PH2017_22_RUC_O_B]